MVMTARRGSQFLDEAQNGGGAADAVAVPDVCWVVVSQQIQQLATIIGERFADQRTYLDGRLDQGVDDWTKWTGGLSESTKGLRK